MTHGGIVWRHACFWLGVAVAAAGASCGVRTLPELTCPSGQTTCGSTCVTASGDSQNCGACGNACSPGTVCYAGTCATSCGGGTTQCGQSCIDTSVDPHHCGTCDSVCPPGNACLAGVCTSTCTAGQTLCTPDGGAYCASTNSDNANCGACGHACAVGTTCVAGACVNQCAAGLTACGAACVDLTSDLSNCGACGQVCTACSAGRCVIEMATTSVGASATGISVDSSYVYWTDGLAIHREDKSGNPATKKELAASSGSFGLAVGALDRLVWGVVNTLNDVGAVGVLDQGATYPVYVTSKPVWSVATDATNAYWADADGVVRGLTLGTTTPWTIAFGESPEDYSPHNIATDGMRVFWIDHMYGGIRAAPVQPSDAGTTTTVFTNLYPPWTIAVDATYLYWADGTIWRGPKDGSSAPSVVAKVQADDFAIDATNVYFIDAGGLERVPLGGGTVTKLVDATVFGEGAGAQSIDIAIDGTAVYWTMYSQYTGGGVWKASLSP